MKETQTKALEELLAYIVCRADAKDIVDRETAGQVGDIIKVANDFMATIERDRIALTKPYRDTADAAKANCDQFLQPLPDALERLRDRYNAWADGEDDPTTDSHADTTHFRISGNNEP